MKFNKLKKQNKKEYLYVLTVSVVNNDSINTTASYIFNNLKLAKETMSEMAKHVFYNEKTKKIITIKKDNLKNINENDINILFDFGHFSIDEYRFEKEEEPFKLEITKEKENCKLNITIIKTKKYNKKIKTYLKNTFIDNYCEELII